MKNYTEGFNVTLEFANCEVCGELATVYVRDLIEKKVNDGDFHEYEKLDEHYFCERHERKSITYSQVHDPSPF